MPAKARQCDVHMYLDYKQYPLRCVRAKVEETIQNLFVVLVFFVFVFLTGGTTTVLVSLQPFWANRSPFHLVIKSHHQLLKILAQCNHHIIQGENLVLRGLSDKCVSLGCGCCDLRIGCRLPHTGLVVALGADVIRRRADATATNTDCGRH